MVEQTKQISPGKSVHWKRSLDLTDVDLVGSAVLFLAFVRRVLKAINRGSNYSQRRSAQKIRFIHGKSAQEQRNRTENCSRTIENQHSSALPEAQIRQPVRGMVLSRRRKGQQSAPRP